MGNDLAKKGDYNVDKKIKTYNSNKGRLSSSHHRYLLILFLLFLQSFVVVDNKSYHRTYDEIQSRRRCEINEGIIG